MNFTPSHSNPPEIISARPPPRHVTAELVRHRLLPDDGGELAVASDCEVVPSDPLFRSFLGLRAYPTEQIIRTTLNESTLTAEMYLEM